MSDHYAPSGPFDIPDVRNIIPRRAKPWLYIFFVLIIQFSGGIYLAAATDMVGTTGLMQQDILMAGYASLVGMSINFAVMFRLKFRFSNRIGLLICGIALIAANFICANTSSVQVLVVTCFFAGWFRMWATLVCNSTIQLWLTPVRDMSVFFCYVYLLVDGVIQLSGLATVYTAIYAEWEYMQWIMTGLLVLMMVLVLLLLKAEKGPMQIPLLGIDWIGAGLWSVFMLCFTFVCVYGDFYDWWESAEITGATLIGLACLAINLVRARFLHHPYISYIALTNHSVHRATIIYLIFFTLMATEHVFEHSYAAQVLGFDEENLISLNWYVLIGIVLGCGFTYFTFARRKWRYRTMTVIAFALAAIYLAYFYFTLDYGVEKEMLMLPLICRGAASCIISIVFLTSIVQGGMHFFVFPQALTLNGFTGAVMGATLGPAIVGELLEHTVAKNYDLLSAGIRATDAHIDFSRLGDIGSQLGLQALVVSMKEIYGLLLIIALISIIVIALGYGPVRPSAIFPTWRKIRKLLKREAREAAD